MPSYFSNDLEKEMRLRKQWRQINLVHQEMCVGTTVSRIEGYRQTPSLKIMETLMNDLGIPIDQFFCPYLINQTAETIIMHDKLLNCLDAGDNLTAITEARKLLNTFEHMKGFDKGINRQFYLSCKARLLETRKIKPSVITPLIYEGMSITYPEFDENNFTGEVLIFEEIEMLHTFALVCGREGNPERAVKLLEKIVNGIKVLPEDDREKEKSLTKILLTLSNTLVSVKEFKKALDICEQGITASLQWCAGRYTPDFALNKGVCLFNLGRQNDCLHFIRLAYFGYMLLRDTVQAEKVKRDAEELYGVTFNTYGVEKLNFDRYDFTPFAYGELPPRCKHIGEVIGKLRVEAGLTLDELSRGICNKSSLSRIEKDMSYKSNDRRIKQPSIYILEALMQRLGRDINLYFDTFLSERNFKEKQMRDKISALLALWKYDEAEALLAELETSKDFKAGVTLQFILKSKAIIISKKKGYGQDFIDMVKEALKITLPDFDERKIEQYRLTYNEILLVNSIATYYFENKNIPKSAKILERLRESMNNSYFDEFEKIRTYSMVLYNYSKYLGLLKRYDEALAIIKEGEELAFKHKRLRVLPGFALNKAYSMFETGKKDEYIPLFALAYYSSELVNKIENQKRIDKYVKENMIVNFN